MDNLHEIRKLIRKTLAENTVIKSNETYVNALNLTPERIEKVNEYVDKKLAEFNEEIKRMVFENNHPYINHYLTMALYDLRQTINDGNCQIQGTEELFI